jgi:hypothetical protein
MNVQIFSMDGRLVKNIITHDNEYIWQGDKQNGQKSQAGIYICKVQSGNLMFADKVVLGR